MRPLGVLCVLTFLMSALPQSASSQTSGLTFASPVSFGSGGATQSVVVADVNGDVEPDFVVANSDQTVGVLLGNGDGTFKPVVTYGIGIITRVAPANVVAVKDLNGDGKPDIVVATCSNDCFDGSVDVLLGNGDGTFQAAVTYMFGSSDPNSIAIVDMNGDGKPDIVISYPCGEDENGHCEGDGSVGVLFGNGDGTFGAATSYNDGGTGRGPGTASLAVADLNGDGKPDIVVINECPNAPCGGDSVAAVLLGNGDGTFQPVVTYDSGGQLATSVVVADVNGDGKPDIVVMNQCDSTGACGSGIVYVLLGNGNGTFQTAVGYGSGGLTSYSLAVADVNGDGKLDAVVLNNCGLSINICSPLTSTVGVLLGNGNGTFQSAITYPSGEDAVSLAVADVNGNGKPDLVVANPVTNTVGVLINTSGFAARTTLTSSANPSNLGQAVTFFATVPSQGGATPTGTVTFICGGTKLGVSSLNSSGVATLTTSKLAVGSHRVTATYSGNANFPSSTSQVLIQTVQGAIAVLSKTSLTFGNQTVGSTSSAQTVTLKNTGNIDLALSITLSGTNPYNFGQSNNCGSSLGPNTSCTIWVKFKPLSAGTRTAAVNISDNAPNSPQKVWLSGTGVQP